MSSEKATKVTIKKRGGSQFWRNLFSKWPVLVWLGIVYFAYALHKSGVKFERMNGVVFGEYEYVSPILTSTIEKLLVDVNDPVTEGQIVAVLDTSLLDLEIKALEEELKIERMERNRRFQDNLNSARLQLLKDTGESESAAFEVQNAQAELDRVNALPDGSVEKLRPNLLVITNELRAAQANAAQYSKEYMDGLAENVTKAQGLIDELEKIDTDSAVSNQLSFLNGQKERMVIRAKNAGFISAIIHRPGDIVKEADPIAVIVTSKPKRVKGIIIDEYVDVVNVGDKVWVSPEHRREDLREASVIAISPTMTAVPDQTSTVPNRMVFGREIICSLPPGDKLLPNQRVIIHVVEPGKVDFWSLGTPHRDPNPREN